MPPQLRHVGYVANREDMDHMRRVLARRRARRSDPVSVDDDGEIVESGRMHIEHGLDEEAQREIARLKRIMMYTLLFLAGAATATAVILLIQALRRPSAQAL